MKTQAGKDQAKAQAESVAEMTEAFRKNCDQALRTGMKLQEEAGRWWHSAFNPAGCVEYWQEQLNAVTRTANNLLPLTQKPVSELIDLAEENGKLSADLMKAAMEASQSAGPADSQAKWTEFWTATLGVAQKNTEAISGINSRMIHSWSAFIRKTADSAEARDSKTA